MSSSGLPVLDAGGRPIVIPARTSHVTIGRDGTIATDSGALGRLQLVRFENEDQLVRYGEGLFAAPGTEQPETLRAKDVDVQQGAIEASNVSPIIEMTHMIELVRNYQSAQRMMDTDRDMQSKAIQDMTAVK